MVPDLELLYAVNEGWWDQYWLDVKDHPCEKWTTNNVSPSKYGINHIHEKWGEGFSEDPTTIHHGHGSGFSLANLAFLKGAERIVLLGYDLRYSADYDGSSRHIGSGPRHSLLLTKDGEYPAALQHWPKVRVKNGVHVELVDLYRSVHDQGLVEIINCSPGSALEGVIPSMFIGDA